MTESSESDLLGFLVQVADDGGGPVLFAEEIASAQERAGLTDGELEANLGALHRSGRLIVPIGPGPARAGYVTLRSSGLRAGFERLGVDLQDAQRAVARVLVNNGTRSFPGIAVDTALPLLAVELALEDLESEGLVALVDDWRPERRAVELVDDLLKDHVAQGW